MNVTRIFKTLLLIGLFASLATSAWAQEAIVGTWHMKVATSAGGFPAFEALQTFHSDGTFTETSSNFATLTEGPAHGVWMRSGNGYLLTFHLFIFDSTRTSVGRVRVRCAITVDPPDHLKADTKVDVIEPNGNIIPDVDSGPFEGFRIKVEPFTTSVSQSSGQTPLAFKLRQNYPNPFNPSTTINFEVPKAAQVTMKVYDTLGREVRTLFDGRLAAGTHNKVWDGKDNDGVSIGSGVYFVKMTTDGFESAKHMVLLK